METSPRYKEKFAFAINIFFKRRMHNIQQYETGRAYNFNKMQFTIVFAFSEECKLWKGITTIHVYLTFTSSHLWNIFKKFCCYFISMTYWKYSKLFYSIISIKSILPKDTEGSYHTPGTVLHTSLFCLFLQIHGTKACTRLENDRNNVPF